MTEDRIPSNEVAGDGGLLHPSGTAESPRGGPARIILAAVGLVTACQFFVTLDDAHEYGGVDQRFRTVCSRAMFQGLDPYYFQWRPEMGDRLALPFEPNAGPTMCSATPITLLAYGTVSGFSHSFGRYAWFAVGWIALGLSVFFLARGLRGQAPRTVLLVGAMLFFACSVSWRVHQERGQYYAPVVLMLSLGTGLLLRSGRDGYAPGVPLGIVILMRPTAAVWVLLLPLLRLRRAAISMAVTAAIGVGATSALWGFGIWPRFFRSAEETMIGYLYPPYFETLEPKHLPQPTKVEGVEFSKMLVVRAEHMTLAGQIYAYFDRRLPPEADRAGLLKKLNFAGQGAYGVVLLAFLLGAWALGRDPSRHDLRIGLAVLAVLDADYLVAVRHLYADILLLVPLAIFLPRLLGSPRGRIYLTLIAFGLLTRLVFGATAIADVLVSLFVTGTLNVFLLAEILRRADRPHAAGRPATDSPCQVPVRTTALRDVLG